MTTHRFSKWNPLLILLLTGFPWSTFGAPEPPTTRTPYGPPPPPPEKGKPPSGGPGPKIYKLEGKTEFTWITRPTGKPEAFFISDWGRVFPQDIGAGLLKFLNSKNRVTLRLSPNSRPDGRRRPGPPGPWGSKNFRGKSPYPPPQQPSQQSPSRNCGGNSIHCNNAGYGEKKRQEITLEGAESNVSVQRVPSVTVGGETPDIIIKLVMPSASQEVTASTSSKEVVEENVPRLVYAPPPDYEY